jgi:hypothetical protein
MGDAGVGLKLELSDTAAVEEERCISSILHLNVDNSNKDVAWTFI